MFDSLHEPDRASERTWDGNSLSKWFLQPRNISRLNVGWKRPVKVVILACVIPSFVVFTIRTGDCLA